MVKGKFEFFNGERRMRFFAVKVFPHNVQTENRALLKRLEIYSHLGLAAPSEDQPMVHDE